MTERVFANPAGPFSNLILKDIPQDSIIPLQNRTHSDNKHMAVLNPESGRPGLQPTPDRQPDRKGHAVLYGLFGLGLAGLATGAVLNWDNMFGDGGSIPPADRTPTPTLVSPTETTLPRSTATGVRIEPTVKPTATETTQKTNTPAEATQEPTKEAPVENETWADRLVNSVDYEANVDGAKFPLTYAVDKDLPTRERHPLLSFANNPDFDQATGEQEASINGPAEAALLQMYESLKEAGARGAIANVPATYEAFLEQYKNGASWEVPVQTRLPDGTTKADTYTISQDVGAVYAALPLESTYTWETNGVEGSGIAYGVIRTTPDGPGRLMLGFSFYFVNDNATEKNKAGGITRGMRTSGLVLPLSTNRAINSPGVRIKGEEIIAEMDPSNPYTKHMNRIDLLSHVVPNPDSPDQVISTHSVKVNLPPGNSN